MSPRRAGLSTLAALCVAAVALVAVAVAVAVVLAPGGTDGGGDPGPQAPLVRTREPVHIEVSPRATAGGVLAGRLSARVVDGLGAPAARCRVRFEPLHRGVAEPIDGADLATTHTAADGRFVLDVASPDPGLLILEHPEFPAQTEAIGTAVEPGTARDLGDLVLRSQPGLVVEVRTREGGRGIAGARIELRPGVVDARLGRAARAALGRTAVSDARGVAVLRGVPPGRHVLRVEAPQHATRELDHDQPEGARFTPRRVVLLAPGEVLLGRLLTRAGTPAAGGQVWVTPPAASGAPETTVAVASDGGFRVAGLVRGRYLVRARSTESPPATVAQDAVDVPGPAITLRLPDPRRLRGVVRDAPSGSPVDGAALWLEALDPGLATIAGTPAVAQSDPQGRFELICPGPGRFLLHAASDRHHPQTFGPLTADGPPTEVALEPGIPVTGIVLDAQRQPVAGAAVASVPNGFDGSPWQCVVRTAASDLPAAVRTGADGRFHLPAAAPGTRVWITDGEHVAFLSAPLAADGGGGDLGAIALERAAVLAGRVLDPLGRPLAGAEVALLPAGSDLRPMAASTHCDAFGRFELRGLAQGAYAVHYASPDPTRQARGETEVRLATGERRVLDLPLRPPGTESRTQDDTDHENKR